MTPEELTQEFIQNSAKMSKYNQAIKLLKEAGFEDVMRRLSEPRAIQHENPAAAQMAAYAHLEQTGWVQAVNFMFAFPELAKVLQDPSGLDGDYGATERLEALGYKKEELEGVV